MRAILDLDNDNPAALRAIESQRSQIKILLKTKDEGEFLDTWVRHHADLYGMDNLLVFDNGSTRPETHAVYDRYESLTVIKYQGLHNYIHDVSRFPTLYASLAASCDFFIFLDTDELLIGVDAGRQLTAEAFRARLGECRQDRTYPATWLYNLPGSTTYFRQGPGPDILPNGLKWGKPLIGSQASVKNYINHNCQIPISLFDQSKPKWLFILHMAQLSSDQRLEANMKKLKARGSIPDNTTLDEVVEIYNDKNDPNVRLYLDEIRRIRARPFEKSPATSLTRGVLRRVEGQALAFFDAADENAYTKYLAESYDW